MPRQSKKIRQIIRSSTSRLNRPTNVISHLESIGDSIVNEIKGLKRDHFKQELLTTSVPNTSQSSVPMWRRSLQQVFTDLHTFDCHNQREYRTVGIGEGDVRENVPVTNLNPSEVSKHKTKRTNLGNLSSMKGTETKKTPIVVTRTICTRSSKLNNKQEQPNPNLFNRTRQRRSSPVNTSNRRKEDRSDVNESRENLLPECLKTTTDL